MFEALIIVATILGPILAVQAQKFLEQRRDEKARRLQVFKVLMATRAARISPEHVQALNMIDLEFPANKFRSVAESWNSYRDHLSPNKESSNEAESALWTTKFDDLFATLLYEMGRSLGYVFDKVQISKGIYSPIALGELDTELNSIRKSLRSLLTGEHALKMDVVSFPDLEDSDSQKQILTGVKKLLEQNDS